MTRTDVIVRNVDSALWRRLKAEAALQGVPIGQLVNAILAPALANIEAVRQGRHTSAESAYQAGVSAGRGRKG